MGNSSSSPKLSLNNSYDDSPFISKPTRLGDNQNPTAVRRRASAVPTGRPRRTSSARGHSGSSTDNNFLSAPGTHRRVRSANASATDLNRHTPPPPYAEAVASAPPSPALASSRQRANGSRHTSVYTVPPASGSSASTHPRAPTSRNSYLRAPMRQNTTENALETLRKFDTVIIVDDSGSMHGALWTEARDALASLAETASKYDTDGIDVYFLNDTTVGSNMRDAASVNRLFNRVKPRGITPIGEKLEELLLEYVSGLEHAKDTDPALLKSIKPINYIVLTDGAPTDDPEAVIVATAKRLDARNFPITQVGIQFVQIGNSLRATNYLKELDDGLSGGYGIRDMVDTTPYTGGRLTAEMLTKILLGGINRRVDRAGAKSVMD